MLRLAVVAVAMLVAIGTLLAGTRRSRSGLCCLDQALAEAFHQFFRVALGMGAMAL